MGEALIGIFGLCPARLVLTHPEYIPSSYAAVPVVQLWFLLFLAADFSDDSTFFHLCSPEIPDGEFYALIS